MGLALLVADWVRDLGFPLVELASERAVVRLEIWEESVSLWSSLPAKQARCLSDQPSRLTWLSSLASEPADVVVTEGPACVVPVTGAIGGSRVVSEPETLLIAPLLALFVITEGVVRTCPFSLLSGASLQSEQNEVSELDQWCRRTKRALHHFCRHLGGHHLGCHHPVYFD